MQHEDSKYLCQYLDDQDATVHNQTQHVHSRQSGTIFTGVYHHHSPYSAYITAHLVNYWLLALWATFSFAYRCKQQPQTNMMKHLQRKCINGPLFTSVMPPIFFFQLMFKHHYKLFASTLFFPTNLLHAECNWCGLKHLCTEIIHD